MNKIFLASLIIFTVLVLSGCNSVQKERDVQNNEIKWLITENEQGEKYPYTENYLTLYCYNNGIWLEDSEGNKYALNGIAVNLLNKHKKYKGTTEHILKKGKIDLYLPNEASQYCLNLTESEFSAR